MENYLETAQNLLTQQRILSDQHYGEFMAITEQCRQNSQNEELKKEFDECYFWWETSREAELKLEIEISEIKSQMKC